MNSKNNLTLTGVVVSDAQYDSERKLVRFTLMHRFGGSNPPLFLKCTMRLDRNEFAPEDCPAKGAQVSIEAYLRPHGNRVNGIIKHLVSEKPGANQPQK